MKAEIKIPPLVIKKVSKRRTGYSEARKARSNRYGDVDESRRGKVSLLKLFGLLRKG